MAVERGYQAQVGARAADVAVQTSPEAFGAGVGSALGDLGQTVHRSNIQANQIERRARADSEATGFARNFAEWRANMDGVIREQRSGAAPGGMDHQQAVRDAYEKGRETLLSGITEDNVRNSAAAQFASFGTSLLEREGTWAEGKRVAKVIDDTQMLSDIGANRVRQMSDQGAYQDEVQAAYAFVDSLQVDDDTKAKLRRELVDQKYAVAYLNGLNDKDPVMARGMLESGAFNEILEPAQIEQLRNGSDIEIRRAAAAAEQEAAMQKAALGEQIQTAKEMDRQGIEIPANQLAALRAAALANGDTSTALQLDGMIANNAFAKAYRGATPIQRERRMGELGGKAKPNGNEQRELEWLRTHSGPLDIEFNNDPVGYAAKHGAGSSVPPPIDLANPASVQARVSWMRQYSQATGRPVPVFSDNELVPLREQVQSGARGRLGVLQALDTIPEAERALAAGQIAPGDVGFRHEALIQPFVRATVFAGREKLVADRGFLTPDRKTREGMQAQRLLNIGGSETDFALRAIDPREAAAVKDISQKWLAGWLSAQGSNVESLTPRLLRDAVTAGFGGVSNNGKYLGGIDHWAGGQAYMVPDGFNHNGFQNYVMRQRTADDKAGNGPANPDGTPFNLNNAYPVFIGNDEKTGNAQYRWETPGGGSTVTTKGGQIYLTRMGARR